METPKDVHPQNKGYMRTEEEGNYLQAKERSPEKPRWHLVFEFPASRTVRKQISAGQAAQSVVLGYGSPSKRPPGGGYLFGKGKTRESGWGRGMTL